MTTPGSVPTSDYDSPWKEALDRYFKAFLRLLFSDIAADIDWDRGYLSLDTELQEVAPAAEQGRRVVDKLVKVWRRNGAEEWVLIHVEIQSDEVGDFAERMFVYYCRIRDRYHRQVASLAVLADDRPGWRPNRYVSSLWNRRVEFEFPTAKLLDWADREAELEGSNDPMAVLILAHLKAIATRKSTDSRHAWKIRLLKGLYERGLSGEDIHQLLKFIDWMMTLPAELEADVRRELQAFEEERKVPYVTSFERLAKEEGRQEGEQTGEQKGIREGLLRAIHLLLEVRFRALTAEVAAKVQQIRDHETLLLLLRELTEASSEEDVRRALPDGE